MKLSAVDAFVAAAEAGRRDVCEWLLRRERKRSAGLQPDELACSGLCPAAAVRGGLTDLAEQVGTCVTCDVWRGLPGFVRQYMDCDKVASVKCCCGVERHWHGRVR